MKNELLIDCIESCVTVDCSPKGFHLSQENRCGYYKKVTVFIPGSQHINAQVDSQYLKNNESPKDRAG